MGIKDFFKSLVIRSLPNWAHSDDRWYTGGGPIMWMGLSPTASGRAVDPYTALNYSAVWAAVQIIAQTAASLPLHLYKSDGENKEIVHNHPVGRMFSRYANSEIAALGFRETGIAHLLLWGNWYAEKVKDRAGRVIELWPL